MINQVVWLRAYNWTWFSTGKQYLTEKEKSFNKSRPGFTSRASIKPGLHLSSRKLVGEKKQHA